MHLYFITRGIKHQIELWEKFMQSQFFNWKRVQVIGKKPDGTNIYGNVATGAVQGSLRPVQLWEYVVPYESMDEVLINMKLHEQTNPAGTEKYAAIMRKLLKLKEVPKMDIKPNQIYNRQMSVAGVGIHPIGIKEDMFGVRNFLDGTGDWEQEFL